MAGVDDKIVEMRFDNEQFLAKIAETLNGLDRLSESLQFLDARDGLATLGSAVDGFDLSNMESAVENISSKFSMLGVVGFEVIRRLTGAAIEFTQSISQKALGPLLGGGKLRAENLEQASFLFRGLGMDVEAGMKSALDAVKGTAFGLDAAAKAAAQLGGSGMQAGAEMTGALRGIAGTAAMTNTSFEEMADVFTSAAGKGKVSGYELQRIGQRGLNAAASLAKVWGTTEAEVRRMATEGEISFEKFAAGMNEAFGEHATKANETYTGSLANMRAALSRIGASLFGPHMLQQRDLFNALTPAIDKVHDAVKPLINSLVGMKGMGVANLIKMINSIDFSNFKLAMPNFADGLFHVYVAVQQVVTVVKEAFREIFPPSTTSLLLSFSEAFLRFAEKLKMGGETAQNVKSIFRGVFAALAIGIEVVRVVAGLFVDLFKTFAAPALSGQGGGVLKFFGDIGESLVRLKETLVDGGGIKEAVDNVVSWFAGIGEKIRPVTDAIQEFKDKLFNMFGVGVDGAAEGVSSGLSKVGEGVSFLQTLVDRLADRWGWLADVLKGVIGVLYFVGEAIFSWFAELGSKLAEVLVPSDFDAAVDIVNVGLLGGIALMIKRFMDGGLTGLISGGTGILSQIQEIFGGLTETLAAMQTELKSKALLNIAIALGVLTASIVVLSMIDSAALAKALGAMTISFGQLVGVMALMEKLSLGLTGAKMASIATGMILISVAVLILSAAVKNLSSLSWEELAKGLIGVAVAMGILVGAISLMTTDVSGLIRASLAMIAMGIALNILALAVKSFAELSWTEMAKGLVGVGAGLGIIIGAMHLIPEGKLIAASIGIGVIAVALNILALAIKSFAEMEWEEMGKGMAGIAGGLTIILIAMNLMPEAQILAASVAMIAMGVALNVIALAVMTMGGIPFGELAKGLGALAVVLGLLVIAMNMMVGTAAGAGALLVTSGALMVLAGVLKTLGGMKIGEIGLALGALAGALLVIGAAGYLMAPIVPALMGLGAAMILIGGAFALFGVGALLVAKAFEIMAKAGKAGIGVMMAAVVALGEVLPKFVQSIAMAIVAFVQEIVEAAPLLLKALAVLVSHILETIITLVPQIVEALGAIISGILVLVHELVPQMIEAGWAVLMAFLQGVRDNIYELVTLGAEILVNLISGIVSNMTLLVDAAVNLITSFLFALAERATDLVTAGLTLLTSLINGVTANMHLVINAVQQLIVTFIAQVTSSMATIIEYGVKVLIWLLSGITDNLVKVTEAVASMIVRFIGALGENTLRIIEAGFKVLKDLLQGIGDNLAEVAITVGSVVSKFIEEVGAAANRIITAGFDALMDFLEGIENNLSEVILTARKLIEKLMEAIADNAVKLADSAFDILTEFLNGLADVIERRAPELRAAGARLAEAIAEGFLGGLDDKAQRMIGAITNPIGTGISIARGLLESNSPSKVFMRFGESIADGLALSLNRDTSAESSMSDFMGRVVNTFQKSVNQIPDALGSMTEFNPTITPVLDLTKVKMGARNLSDMMMVSKIAPTVSIDRAQQISTTAETAGTDTAEPAYVGPSEVTFEQNIYAPTALSTNDIYRNTKSQIALAKEELNI